MFDKETLLAYFHEKEGLKTVRAKIKSLRKERGGEFALLSTGEKIHLDQIKSVNGIAL
jgi:hypothetical protein